MTPTPPLRIFYMPWADLKNEVSVGPVKFMPFAAWLKTIVPDIVTRRFWERYARCHIGMDGRPTESHVMALVDGAPFGALTQKQEVYIHRAANALAFAHLAAGYGSRALSENRRLGGMPIAHVDRFMLYSKSFCPSDRSATITTKSGMATWSLAELRWQRPSHAWSGLCVPPDLDLLAGLGRIVNAGPRHPFANQIWSAIEWVRTAFTGGDGFEETMRLVIMMTAFECLLAKESDAVAAAEGRKSNSGGDVKRAFKGFVDKHLIHIWLSTTRRDFGKKHGILSIPTPADWFYEAFDLRGGIVHGEPLHRGRGAYQGHPHLLLAVLFMWHAIKARLVKAGISEVHLSKQLRDLKTKLNDGIRWTTQDEREQEFSTTDLRQLYNALGWISPEWKRKLRHMKKHSRIMWL